MVASQFNLGCHPNSATLTLRILLSFFYHRSSPMRAVANAHNPLKSLQPVPIVVSPSSYPTGILHRDSGGPSIPFHSWQFKDNNQWFGLLNGNYTQVVAGSDPQNPKQGMVVINGVTGYFTFYRTTALDGGLTITAANGSVLMLKADDGAHLYLRCEHRVAGT